METFKKANLPTLLMHLSNCLYRIQMVNSRIEPNLVHYHNPCVPRFLVQSAHSRRDVGCSDDVGLTLDSSLDDCGMVSVGDKGNDEVMFGNGSLEGRCGGYI